jgi:hypothetical protein
MTLAKAFEIFDILLDKYGAPYFPDIWKEDMFNMSQNEYLHDLLPEEGGEGVNFDLDANVTATIQPLIWTVSSTLNGSGIITDAVLNAAIQAVSSDATATTFKIMSIGVTATGRTYPVKYVKQNNIRAFQNNVFKEPRNPDKMRYSYVGNGLQFYPSTPATAVTITVIKTPRNVSLTGPINPEWSDYVCYNIIAKMLKLAGITTESPELINDIRMASIAG